MKAVLIKEFGDADQLIVGEYPEPEPGADELLIKVEASALNRADLFQRQGKYPPPPGASPILGLEVAGIIQRKGSACKKWKEGDPVCGILAGGGYAEYVTMHEDIAMAIPEQFSFEEAAAIPEAFLTAYQTLMWLGKLQKGQQVLVHAAASGVGTAAIQLIHSMGAHAIAVAGQDHKLDICQKLGAFAAFNYKGKPFAQEVLNITNQKGADIIMDFIGASFWEQNINALAQDGIMIIISTLGGSIVEKVDLRMVMKKRAHIIATTLRARSLEYKIALTTEFANRILPQFSTRKLNPIVDRVFQFEHVQEAHRYMENNKNIGKIILKL